MRHFGGFGDIPNFLNPSYKDIMGMINNGMKPLALYHLTKEEVLNKDLSGVDKALSNLKQVGKRARQSFVITCGGYDDVSDELHEIKEVREFVDYLFQKHPYLLYYINKELEGHAWLLCSYADEIVSVSEYEGDKPTANELFERFGFDVPQMHSHLTFTEQGEKLETILSAVVKHGKTKKDVKGAKKIAIEYALQFSHTESILCKIGVTPLDLIELGFVVERQRGE